jgi:hypothetical protein
MSVTDSIEDNLSGVLVIIGLPAIIETKQSLLIESQMHVVGE